MFNDFFGNKEVAHNHNIRLNKLELDMVNLKGHLEIIDLKISAVINYLNIELEWEEQDDPYYLKPKTPKISILKACKKTKK